MQKINSWGLRRDCENIKTCRRKAVYSRLFIETCWSTDFSVKSPMGSHLNKVWLHLSFHYDHHLRRRELIIFLLIFAWGYVHVHLYVISFWLTYRKTYRRSPCIPHRNNDRSASSLVPLPNPNSGSSKKEALILLLQTKQYIFVIRWRLISHLTSLWGWTRTRRITTNANYKATYI